MIFVDTSAWYATYVASDPNHAIANAFYTHANDRFVTTDYILDEALTLLGVRGEIVHAIEFGERILAGQLAMIEWVQPSDVHRAWIMFRANAENGWSFTDCISRVVMTRLGIKKAFTFDRHFRQFGTVEVVP